MCEKYVPLIVLDKVSIRLWERIVFDKISWKIYPDEFWAVTGNAGCGKSVLVRVLRGEFPLAAGQIDYNFKKSDNPFLGDDPQMRIGYVGFDLSRQMKPDQNRFVQSRYWSNDESLTVKNYLSKEQVYQINPFEIINKRMKSSSFNQTRRELLQLFQIENLLSREVDMLSNGECRKVAMVYELLKEPQLLIIDNPFQGLDSRYRNHLCNAIIPLLISRGITCMLITCDKNDLPGNVTHLLEIDSFKITSSGPWKHCRKMTDKIKMSAGFPGKRSAESVAFFSNNHSGSCQSLVRMKYVNVKAGRKTILKDINWTINRGEHWAVTGSNGSGKTTLLSLILGDHPQMYANDIEIFGVRWGHGSNIWSVKKRIGWVSPELQTCYSLQTNGSDVVLSGYSDSIGLFSRPSKQKRERVARLFTAFGISQLAEIPFGSMSEGNQRLLLVLRAIVKGPELLILDEPCQGLPFDSRQLVISTIDTLALRCNTTIIFVTHQQDELPSCINKILDLGMLPFKNK